MTGLTRQANYAGNYEKQQIPWDFSRDSWHLPCLVQDFATIHSIEEYTDIPYNYGHFFMENVMIH